MVVRPGSVLTFRSAELFRGSVFIEICLGPLIFVLFDGRERDRLWNHGLELRLLFVLYWGDLVVGLSSGRRQLCFRGHSVEFVTFGAERGHLSYLFGGEFGARGVSV